MKASARPARVLSVVLAVWMLGAPPREVRLRWAAIFTPGGTPYGVAVSPDGTRVYLTGCNSGCAGDYMTAAFDAATGGFVWNARYNGPARGQDYAYAIGVGPDGQTVYITGASDGGGVDYGDYATIAYDAASGTQTWVARYDRGNLDSPCCLEVSPDGARVYVTGQSRAPSGAVSYDTVAYDAASGDQLWEVRYDNGLENLPNGLTVSPDGTRVFVTGKSWKAKDNDYATVAYDAGTGTQLWEARYENPAMPADTAYAVAVDPAGSFVYVTGCLGTSDICVQADVGTIAYEAATGAQVWVATYDGPIHGYDAAYAAETSPDGNVLYVGGSTDQLSSLDFGLIAYDAPTGQERWAGTYNGPGSENDYGCCLDVSPDGTTVVMAGSTYELGDSSFATVSFGAEDGTIRWSARNKGGHQGYNVAKAVAMSPLGDAVYVTGTTITRSGHYAFFTLAYRA